MKVLWIANVIVVVFAWLTLRNPWLARSRGRAPSDRVSFVAPAPAPPPPYVASDLHYDLPPMTNTRERRAGALSYERTQDTRLEYALKVGLLFVLVVVLVYINV